jgi:hypothetical protein
MSLERNKKEENSLKRIWKVFIISMVLAGILIAVLAVNISAAGPQSNGSNGSGQVNNSTVDVVSKLLGFTPEQVQVQRQAGKSLVQIAATKNVTEESLINAIMAQKQMTLKNMVTAGAITQIQADQRLVQIRERVKLAINRTTIGPPEWSGANGQGQNGFCNGNGIMRQGGPKGNQESCTGVQGTCTGAGKMLRAGRATK